MVPAHRVESNGARRPAHARLACFARETPCGRSYLPAAPPRHYHDHRDHHHNRNPTIRPYRDKMSFYVRALHRECGTRAIEARPARKTASFALPPRCLSRYRIRGYGMTRERATIEMRENDGFTFSTPKESRYSRQSVSSRDHKPKYSRVVRRNVCLRRASTALITQYYENRKKELSLV